MAMTMTDASNMNAFPESPTKVKLSKPRPSENPIMVAGVARNSARLIQSATMRYDILMIKTPMKFKKCYT